jgi:enamine deaminase RidA (YjgF/YER057c/UK114 family)/acyl-coenzyme A thioesterase PaaI-like protein
MGDVRLSGREIGYHQASAGGGVVALSGQTADSRVIDAGAGFVAEFDSALGRVVEALAAAGGAPADLLQLRFFVTDLEAYVTARPQLADLFKARLGGHYPANTLIEVSGLLGGAQVEIEGIALRSGPSSSPVAADRGDDDAVIRLRLAPADARYAPRTAAGSKAMEIFADLETELALREGGDEGLCAAYDMVEFLSPLRVGDFVEGRARIVGRGRTSRRVSAEIHKVVEVDDDGVLLPTAEPTLAARASATIVVGTSGAEGRA